MKDRIKFLVIDDKKIIGDIFEVTLGYSGHDIRVTQDGDEGIELIKENKYDVVFLDILMPKKDGVAILEEIKEVVPKLPVIMMTGYSLDEQRQKTQELGALGCLNKPFEMDDVRQAVRIAVGMDI